MSYIKAACISIAQKVADGAAPPRKKPDDGDGGWLRPKEVGMFKHVDPVYGVQHQAKFAAEMSVGRQLHEEGLLAKDAVEAAGLLEQLEQPAAEKPKEAEDWTCKYKGCNGKYTDARDSGASSKYNCGFCSSECREAAKKAPRVRAPPTQCEHGRRKSRCKDCGTGYCQHGRQLNKCKDCGTGYCVHNRQKSSKCKDCGTGYCHHGHQKHQCRDCGTGHCEHGRQKRQCKDCRQ
jgi:hypothetical protein